jgi:hypothetical protein
MVSSGSGSVRMRSMTNCLANPAVERTADSHSLAAAAHRELGWLPPYWCPSRRLLRSRGEGRGLVTLPKIAPIPGPRLLRWFEIAFTVFGLSPITRPRSPQKPPETLPRP